MAQEFHALNERAQQLLKTLVERYIADGQPVGSRALSKYSGLDLSPASIRNVMADLEDMGFIASPHTSAGRIPTPRGYRFFVDTLLTVKPLDRIEINQLEGQLQVNNTQKLVASASHLLSDLTRFAGVVVTPRRSGGFRHIEFLRLAEKRILLILVTAEGDVQNRIIQTDKVYSPSELVEAANILNQNYAGCSFDEIRRRGLKSVSAVFRELGAGKEDAASKPGLASLLKTLWPGEYEDERDARFINDRHLPDKAIDVIDEAGAAQKILPKSKQKRVIGKHEIEEIIAKITRIPTQTVSVDDRNALKTLDRDLKAVVFGQDKAIGALTAAIRMARSGLGNPAKPIGSFLFSGPTGVGKTEVARQLAYVMGVELLRFDMSEYMERHAVSRLIGAPPGYIGFDQGGLLTEAITKNPYSVLLLDEIEKAHPDIFNILLQVMDHGTLTDNNGRKADFRNVVIIMTTNAGAAELSKTSMGFTTSREAGDEMGEIKRMFTPEFRNRIDAIISFQSLDRAVILRVVDKFLMQLEEQLHEKKVDISFTPALREHLAEKGFDPQMGARPMSRLIQDTIRSALADELLFGRLVNGGKVTVDLDATGKVRLEFAEEPVSVP